LGYTLSWIGDHSQYQLLYLHPDYAKVIATITNIQNYIPAPLEFADDQLVQITGNGYGFYLNTSSGVNYGTFENFTANPTIAYYQVPSDSSTIYTFFAINSNTTAFSNKITEFASKNNTITHTALEWIPDLSTKYFNVYAVNKRGDQSFDFIAID